MKKTVFLILALLIMAPLVEAAPSLSVGWQLSSDTLRPKSDATLTMTFTNTGLTEMTNVFVEATLGPYLKLTSGEPKQEIGALGATALQQAAISFKVDDDAISTTTFVTLEVKSYTSTSEFTKTISIPITIRRNPILQIENVEYLEEVAPGKTTTLSFDVVNAGDGPAKDLKISLNQTELFIVPTSGGETLIKTLGASERTTVEFPITINPDASIGINSVVVGLSYYDETNSDMFSETNKIGLSVTGEANFVISMDGGTGFYYGQIGEAEIEISNSGSGPAEFVTIVAESDYGSKEIYIGSLDADDSETIRVVQDLRSVSQKYPIKLKISYRDKFQNEYSVVKTVEAIPENAPADYTMVIILVALIGIAIWYYRRRKKK